MARKRLRSAVRWVFIFLNISSFWGIIALLVLGGSKQIIRERVLLTNFIAISKCIEI